MGLQYKGNRYVPKPCGVWTKEVEYEPLSIVTHEGASFTSKTIVPVGIEITNESFWVLSGNYNAQVEQYRQETIKAVSSVNQTVNNFANQQDKKFQEVVKSYKNDMNLFVTQKYAGVESDISKINKDIESASSNLNASIDNASDRLNSTVNSYTTIVNNQLAHLDTVIQSIDIEFDEGTSTDIEDENITDIEGNGGVN